MASARRSTSGPAPATSSRPLRSTSTGSARAAANDWDDAGAAWDRGDHLEAVGDGASAIGTFAMSSGEAAVDPLGDAASAVGDAIFGGPSMMDIVAEQMKKAAEED
jgi:hypothetical protein